MPVVAEVPASVKRSIHELPSSNPPPPEIADADQGFQSLYTGVDLSGWKPAPGHDGHWTPKDWILDYDGKSEATDKNLWTEKEYGDFMLIADWRFTRKPELKQVPFILSNGAYATNDDGSRKTVEAPDAGDSGIFMRTVKAQVNIWCWPVGSGEVWGYREDTNQPPQIRAAVTPKLRADNPPGEWNRFKITLKGDRLSVVLNGKTVIESARLPAIPARAAQSYGWQHGRNDEARMTNDEWK